MLWLMLTGKIIQYRLVFKLNKESSLKSKAEIEEVFGFGKKTHGRATERNKIKRLLRDCLRQSHEFEKFNSGRFIIIYHSEEMPALRLLQENIKTLFLSLSKKELS